MDPDLLLPAGYRLVAYDSVGSTNDEARRLAMDGAPDGTVIRARRQTAGRGRRGRSWESQPGNLYCSVIVRPDRPVAEAAQFSFVTALALGEAVSGLLPDDVTLCYKWPNDLLLERVAIDRAYDRSRESALNSEDRPDSGPNGAKVAGILLESAGAGAGFGGGGLDWLVIGCGLNIAHYPALTDGYPATSLAAAGCRPVPADDMLVRFITAFDRWRRRWREEGIAAVRAAWIARAAGLGEDIEVRLPNDRLRGRFAGLDESGALLLDLPDGARRVISAGDVFF